MSDLFQRQDRFQRQPDFERHQDRHKHYPEKIALSEGYTQAGHLLRGNKLGPAEIGFNYQILKNLLFDQGTGHDLKDLITVHFSILQYLLANQTMVQHNHPKKFNGPGKSKERRRVQNR